MQDDALVPTATSREALAFSASMRLPATYSREKIRNIVEKLIGDLGLEGCADVMIGGAMIKGISGGQRKRVSVGIELVTDPALLFLDEPTSGLDSYTAYSIVGMLRTLSNTTECTVLCTIHQPSSEVFFLFDSVIFMKAGRIFYQGPCKEVASVFGKLGYHCPHSYNPSDFVMTLTQTVSHEEAMAKSLYMTMPDELQDLGHAKTSSRLDGEVEFLVERSFFRQLGALTYREAVSTSRDKGALIGRFGITAFLNLLFGLIFLGVGGRDYANPTNFNNHFGAVAMVLISGMFGSAQPIMLSFPFERPIFMREYSTGTCT
ncbi:ATP-binding cassette domain-containing protein [archaeon]|nr:MAG: ATP-binding cassette domain-containing protein [archaeon]